MISQLRGIIAEKDIDSVTIDVNGVGYKIFVSNNFLSEISNYDKNTDITVYTYLAVRETALDLYGFINSEDKKLFKLLLTISGIGPKSAMSIMSAVTKEMIEESISKNDAKYLSKISGIGKKTAEKIIMGLKDKIGTIESLDINSGSDNSMVIDALTSLGYSERDAREVIKKIETAGKTPQDIIREALKILSSN